MNESTPLLPQLAAMLATVMVCGALIDGSYARFASSAPARDVSGVTRAAMDVLPC